MDDLSSSASGPGTEPEAVSHSIPTGDGKSVSRERRRPVSPAPSACAGECDGKVFLELRRKVQSCELLSAATEKLLGKMKFNGHLTVVVQHGRVVKTGYEEGYFRRRNDLDGVLFETS